MKNSEIYDSDNEVVSNIPLAYEPPPEIKARYRNFEILTITALVLLFVIYTHGLILVAVRVVFSMIAIKELIAFFVGLFILVMGVGLWRGYDYICHSLSYANIITIVVTEVVMLVAQVVMCNFCVAYLLKYMIILSVVFILYVLIFLKCKFIFRALIAVITIPVLVATNYTHLHSLEFTPRYIYMSTSGYQDKISDKVSYYYEEPINKFVGGQYSIDTLIENINEISKWPMYISQVEETESGDYLKYLDIISSEICKLSDVVNFNGKYDDSFFKNSGLCISVLELENPNDTIECTDFQYSLAFGRPIIEYTRSKSPVTDERAICIIIYEVPNIYKESVFFHAATFNTRKSTIYYS